MIAIIPARGGSKGLPGKNIRELLGKPLVAYTIESALKANAISKVIVSTDDHDIKNAAIAFGANVPFLRPPHLATDQSLAIDTYLFTIEELEKIEGTTISEFVVLLPTSPLRLYSDIDSAVNMFKQKNADSVISFTEESHPIMWHKFIDKENKFIDIFDSKDLNNRQDNRKSYYPNGSIYVFKKSILEQGLYYTENSFAYLMPRNRSVDIDTIEDFNYAEFLLKSSA